MKYIRGYKKRSQNKTYNVDLSELNTENERKAQEAKFQPTPVEKHNFNRNISVYWWKMIDRGNVAGEL